MLAIIDLDKHSISPDDIQNWSTFEPPAAAAEAGALEEAKVADRADSSRRGGSAGGS